MANDNMIETCKHCDNEYSVTDMHETGSGELCCDNCAMDYCERCLDSEADCELSSGDYVCSDCYSGMCDDAYDRERDKDYA